MKHYIVLVSDTDVHFRGPFDNDAIAHDWAMKNNPADDPRWQIVALELPNPNATHTSVEIWPIEAGPMVFVP